MAEKRVIEYEAASELANDDWLLIDGVTEGTRKARPNVVTAELGAQVTNIATAVGGLTAELVDIKVGADGVTYASAGDAVRGQVIDLRKGLCDVAVSDDPIELKNRINIAEYVDNNGAAGASNSSSRSDYIPIYKGWEIKFSNVKCAATGNIFSFYTSKNESTYDPASGIAGQGTTGAPYVSGSYTAQSDGFFRLCCNNNYLSGSEFLLISPLSEKYKIIDSVENLLDNNLCYYKLGTYKQGYYDTSGIFKANNNYVAPEIFITENEKTFLFPFSEDYDLSIYTWDYSQGSYSNFEQTGWISADTTIKLTANKAMSAIIRTHGGGATPASSVTYKYYLLTATGEHEIIKTWTPKKVACIGDSLTEGVDIGTHVIKENYPYFMSKMLGCTALNYGVAGADTKEYWHDNLSTFTFDNSIDTVLIMLGTNGGGIPNTLATDVYPYTDYEDYADTYCGCYCKIIRKVIELTENRAQVILITPPYTTYSTSQLNRVKEARETILEIGLYFNIPVIDVFKECGMSFYNANIFRPHDGCHFNAKGYHRLGSYIGSKVKSLHSIWNLSDEYEDETPTN